MIPPIGTYTLYRLYTKNLFKFLVGESRWVRPIGPIYASRNEGNRVQK